MACVRSSNPRWRGFDQSAVVPVLLPTLVVREVQVIEKANVGLFVERHLNDIIAGQVVFVMQEVHVCLPLCSDVARRHSAQFTPTQPPWQGSGK
jgi:hypothetical protein